MPQTMHNLKIELSVERSAMNLTVAGFMLPIGV
jgi:hypothetical protein